MTNAPSSVTTVPSGAPLSVCPLKVSWIVCWAGVVLPPVSPAVSEPVGVSPVAGSAAVAPVPDTSVALPDESAGAFSQPLNPSASTNAAADTAKIHFFIIVTIPFSQRGGFGRFRLAGATAAPAAKAQNFLPENDFSDVVFLLCSAATHGRRFFSQHAGPSSFKARRDSRRSTYGVVWLSDTDAGTVAGSVADCALSV